MIPARCRDSLSIIDGFRKRYNGELALVDVVTSDCKGDILADVQGQLFLTVGIVNSEEKPRRVLIEPERGQDGEVSGKSACFQKKHYHVGIKLHRSKAWCDDKVCLHRGLRERGNLKVDSPTFVLLFRCIWLFCVLIDSN